MMDMIEDEIFNIPSAEAPRLTLREMFAAERVSWRDRVIALARRLKDMGGLSDLEIDLHTVRQEVLELKYLYLDKATMVSNQLTKAIDSKASHYRKENLKANEILKAIKSSTADMSEKQEQLGNHSKYMSETIDSIDHIIWAIKHRGVLEDYKRRQ